MSYLDSKRIVGTNSQRTGSFANITGGWKEVGRTTLGSSGDTIDVTSLPDKRYYMILMDYRDTGGQINTNMTINNDTGNNYARRWSTDGATDSTQTSRNSMNHGHYTANDGYAVAYLSNVSSKEKLLMSHSVANHSGTGAGTAPNRNEFVGKWANTSNVVSSIKHTNSDTGSFTSGSEVVVLGYNPDDTHTDNFWEELASVELTSTNTVLDSGTFTAKKYLWIQLFAKANTSLTSIGGRYNGDTGNNYANRYSDNGGTDGTNTSQPIHTWTLGGNLASGETQFTNVFVINNASNEKLSICNTVEKGTSGAGTAPTRRETVGKWANTTDQITQVQLVRTNTTGDFASGSFIKVWGSN